MRDAGWERNTVKKLKEVEDVQIVIAGSSSAPSASACWLSDECSAGIGHFGESDLSQLTISLIFKLDMYFRSYLAFTGP